METIWVKIEVSDNGLESNAAIITLLYIIRSPVNVSSIFSQYQRKMGWHGFSIVLRHRLVCTPGSCGIDCSQYVSCPEFSDVCGLSCNGTDSPCSPHDTCVVSY